MWYLDHYRFSPLDPRYSELPYEFIEATYVRFFCIPDPEKIRDFLVKKKAEDKKLAESDRMTEESLNLYGGFDEDTKKFVLEQFKGASRG